MNTPAAKKAFTVLPAVVAAVTILYAARLLIFLALTEVLVAFRAFCIDAKVRRIGTGRMFLCRHGEEQRAEQEYREYYVETFGRMFPHIGSPVFAAVQQCTSA